MNNALFFSLFLCVLIQIGYCLYYFIPFIFYRPKRVTNADFPVSVIVAAHNELPNLQHLLPLLQKQTYLNYEVIVVDDRSEDGSKKYLAELCQNFENLRIVPIEQTPPGLNPKKYALAQGVAAAQHEHLLFTDADCKPVSENWITEIVRGFFADTSIVLGFSPYIRKLGFLNALIRYETLVTAIQYLSFSVKGSTYMGVGRNLAYTKTCFKAINGFDSHKETLGGDDDLFIRDARATAKVNIVITKESQTESIPKQRYQEWIIQKRRHLSVGRQYKLSDKLRIGIYMLANIFFYLLSIMLLFWQGNLFLLCILVSVRFFVIYPVYLAIARKLKEQLSVMLLPLLDLAYILNYLVLGISVLMFKKVRWK